jgi:hypothetical protein
MRIGRASIFARIAIVAVIAGGAALVRQSAADDHDISATQGTVDRARHTQKNDSAAEQNGDTKSRPLPEIGNRRGGTRFRQVGGNGDVLVGCEVTLARISGTSTVRSIIPIFEKPDGSRSTGKPAGLPNQAPLRVEAEPHYAVGKIVGMAGNRINAFYLVFMRRRDGKLDPSDSYESRWFGGRTNNPIKEIADPQNRPAIGITGRAHDTLDSISLLFE